MRDAISGLIGRYDQLGRYFDRSAIDSIESYLDGLDDTYKSLGVPTGPTVRSIVLLGEVVAESLLQQGVPAEQLASVLQPFDHLARGLGETNVRQR
jgi:phycobilisome core component